MVAKLDRVVGGEIGIGDRAVIQRPDVLHETPGWHPWLDRLNGTTVIVRTVAHGDGFSLVLVHESPLPLNASWLCKV